MASVTTVKFSSMVTVRMGAGSWVSSVVTACSHCQFKTAPEIILNIATSPLLFVV